MKGAVIVSAVLALGLHAGCSLAQSPAPKPPFTLIDAEAGKKLADKSQEIRKQITMPLAAAEPFKMIGNLYFVGIQNGDAYLLTSSNGHILFGAGFPNSGEIIEKNIHSLGFKITDIKAILINHWHPDQAGGSRYLKQKSGAKLLAAFAEIPYIENGGALPAQQLNPLAAVAPDAPPRSPAAPPYPPVMVDRALSEGDVVEVGSSVVTTYLIPGHSPSSTTFVFNVRDEGRTYKAIQYCCWEYPEDLSRNVLINEASVRRSFETLGKIGPIDIYMELGRYGWGGVLNQPEGLGFVERIENVRKNPMLMVNSNIFRQLNAAREVEFEAKLIKLKQTSPAYAP